jgi:hypothetical protein
MAFIKSNLITACKSWEQKYRDFRIEYDNPENPELVEDWGYGYISCLKLINCETICDPSIHIHQYLAKPLVVMYWTLDNNGDYKLRTRGFKKPKSALDFMRSLG